MREQPLWYWPGCIPLLSGLLWLYAGWHHPWGWLLAIAPGCVQVAAGTGLLLWPGDRRIPQCLALSAVFAVLLSIPAIWAYGLIWAGVLVIASIIVYYAAGYAALHHEPLLVGIPDPVIDSTQAAKVALDDALVGYFVLSAQVPTGAKARRTHADFEGVGDFYREKNWLDNPASFHRTPVLPTELHSLSARTYGHAFSRLSFESAYQPWEGDPGAEGWMSKTGNRTAHAWMIRHPGPPRPWLLCIHGYRMGTPALDFLLFSPRWLHHRLGLNLLMPVLPLHGPRKFGMRSGDGYMDGNFSNFIQAEAQAMFDLRSWLRWLRESERAPGVGVLGYSLGGYNAALLSCLEPELACVIAGIPLVDVSAVQWRHMPPLQLKYLESLGFSRERASETLRVVSPLAMQSKVEQRHRHIFGGVADRLVPPAEVQRLANHWGTEVTWYQGTHLSFRREAAVSSRIHNALLDAGLTGGEQQSETTQFASGLIKP